MQKFESYLKDIEQVKERMNEELTIAQEASIDAKNCSEKLLKELKSDFSCQLSRTGLEEKQERGKLQDQIVRLLQQRKDDVQ